MRQTQQVWAEWLNQHESDLGAELTTKDEQALREMVAEYNSPGQFGQRGVDELYRFYRWLKRQPCNPSWPQRVLLMVRQFDLEADEQLIPTE